MPLIENNLHIVDKLIKHISEYNGMIWSRTAA